MVEGNHATRFLWAVSGSRSRQRTNVSLVATTQVSTNVIVDSSGDIMGLKIKEDKAKHMGGSFLLTLAGYAATRKLWVAVLIAFVIGLLKEFYDIYHGVASWLDMAANILGICFAVVLIYVFAPEE
jgi:membrane associated rhomboid family serine protease